MNTNQAMPNPYGKVQDRSDLEEKISRPSSTYWQDVFRRFRRDPLAVGGMIVILIIALAAIVLPAFLPYSYDGMDLSNMNQGPTFMLLDRKSTRLNSSH